MALRTGFCNLHQEHKWQRVTTNFNKDGTFKKFEFSDVCHSCEKTFHRIVIFEKIESIDKDLKYFHEKLIKSLRITKNLIRNL